MHQRVIALTVLAPLSCYFAIHLLRQDVPCEQVSGVRWSSGHVFQASAPSVLNVTEANPRTGENNC